GVTFAQRESKEGKEIGIRRQNRPLEKRRYLSPAGIIADQLRHRRVDACGILYLRKFPFQRVGQRKTGGTHNPTLRRPDGRLVHAVHAVRVGMVTIEAELMLYIGKDQDARPQANGQTQYVNCREIPVAEEISNSDGYIISRSEERRVGKECRSRWSPDHDTK